MALDHEQPFVEGECHTTNLPDTAQRDHRIPALARVDAPTEVLARGDQLGEPVEYQRRIGRYLLGRPGLRTPEEALLTDRRAS